MSGTTFIIILLAFICFQLVINNMQPKTKLQEIIFWGGMIIQAVGFLTLVIGGILTLFL